MRYFLPFREPIIAVLHSYRQEESYCKQNKLHRCIYNNSWNIQKRYCFIVRSSRSVFYKCALKNFAKFTGKHLSLSVSLFHWSCKPQAVRKGWMCKAWMLSPGKWISSVANTPSKTEVKDDWSILLAWPWARVPTHRTDKQIAELFSQAFSLLPRCIYPLWPDQNNIKIFQLKGS